MIVDEKLINIDLFKISSKKDLFDKLVSKLNYPTKREYYECGFLDRFQIKDRLILNFAVTSSMTSKTIAKEKNDFKIITKPIKVLNIGKVSFYDKRNILELINCNLLLKNVIKGELEELGIKKVRLPDEIYDKLYKNIAVKTSGKYILKTPYKSYKVNVSSKPLEEEDLSDIFKSSDVNSISFNGRAFEKRELAFKISRLGKISFYNFSKTPLEWEELFDFLESKVYLKGV